jgi:lipid II:glycine glycyltransferase (peptidoglycan interpeptide bridge formation enzyme)
MLSVRTLTSDDSPAINRLEVAVADYKRLKTGAPSHGGDTVNLLEQQALVLGVFDQESRLLSVRGAALFGNTACDIVAATSPEGRRVYASYLATWSLLSALKDRNITSFDFSGIDDLRNKGVSDFKRGLGGKEVIYFPERHLATPRLVLPLAALLIRYRVQRSHS